MRYSANDWTRQYPSRPQYHRPPPGFSSPPHSYPNQYWEYHQLYQYCSPPPQFREGKYFPTLQSFQPDQYNRSHPNQYWEYHQLYQHCSPPPQFCEGKYFTTLQHFQPDQYNRSHPNPSASRYAKELQYFNYDHRTSSICSLPLPRKSTIRSREQSAKHSLLLSQGSTFVNLGYEVQPSKPRHDHRYQPIDRSKRMIRLIQLSPNISPDGRIQCRLKNFELAECPQYLTLSYTWSEILCERKKEEFNESQKEIILVDGQHFGVGPNLFAFLWRFRTLPQNCDQSQRNRLAWLWIDQLSIDQQNGKEKTHQVRLMGDIYGRSKLTISWLGYKFDGDLKRHEYFRRVWIIQELVLSRKVLLLWGLEDPVAWETFAGGDYVADNSEKLGPFCVSSYPGVIERIRKEYAQSTRKSDGEPGLHLIDILSYVSRLESEKLEDQIYGLLGLVKTNERPVIDYRKTVQQVFLDAATIILNSPARIDPKILLLCQVGESMRLIYDFGIPISDTLKFTKPYPVKFLREFIAHLEEFIDRLSTLPIQHQHKRVSKLGFRRFTRTHVSLPLWAVDRDWKNCPGKWWFEYCGQKYCFAKSWYRLERVSNGVLGGLFGDRGEDAIFYLPLQSRLEH